MNDKTCVFCKIAKGEIPSECIIETDDLMVIENINPEYRVHLLAIPKEHIVLTRFKPKGCDKAILADLMLAAREGARLKKIDKGGYRIVVNTGKDALADFEHLHLHIMGGEKLMGL